MEGVQKSGSASHGNKKEGVGARTSRHANQHSQSSVNIQKTRAIKKG